MFEVSKKIMSVVKVSAPGKIILTGEHSVVYGYPAILASVDKRLSVQIQKSTKSLTVAPAFAHGFVKKGMRIFEKAVDGKINRNLRVKFESNILIGRGMGSSAATSVSLAAALLKYFRNEWNLKEINSVAYEMEKLHHGNPSGGDNTTSTYGGFLWFRKESEKFKIFSEINIKKKIPRLFLVDSGKPKETTKDMVFFVKDLYKKNPKKIEKILCELGDITNLFLKYLLKEERVSFPGLLRENEHMLEKLGVVSSSTKKVIRKIEDIGGSAKISGAGGKTGASGVIIAYHSNPVRLKSLAKNLGLNIFGLKLGKGGVKLE